MIPPHHGEGEPRASWRLLTTPLGDLLRGRITGPRPPRHLRGWRGVVAASDLPAALRDTIAAVAGSLRLWREEKGDVARELAAHFADGLASGATPEALRESFGDPKQAARLITRAKKRARPLWWQAIRRARQLIALGFVLALIAYAYLAAQFWLRSPAISRDYLAELNAAAMQAPEIDRAWPLYMKALIDQENLPQQYWWAWGDYRPGDPQWPGAVAYLERNQAVIETLARAAARPVFGMPVSTTIPPELSRKIWSRHNDGPPPPAAPPEPRPMVIDVLLPHLGEMRSLARLLRMDIAAAAEKKDGERVLRDLAALMGMRRHLQDGPFFITQLVALALESVAMRGADEILRDSPDALTDAQWARAAHTLAAAPPVRPDLAGDRMFFDDILQRAFSNEGGGHGRLTARGLGVIGSLGVSREDGPDLGALALGPINAAAVPDRKELSEQYTRVVAEARARRDQPMWRWTASLDDEQRPGVTATLLKVMLPAFDSFYAALQRREQERDATLTAIALHLYKRRHGDWPASLADLVPTLLPAVPPDRIDGQPMRYLVRDGRPRLYSIGLDRDDDAGRIPAAGPMANYRWLTPGEVAEKMRTDEGVKMYDGDLVLWPPPPREPLPERDEHTLHGEG